MGCKSSKVESENNEIDSNFEQTRIPAFDDIFNNASSILETCEKIRAGLEDTKEEGMEIAGTEELEEPKYIETLRVLFWAFYAELKGRNLDLGLGVQEEKPFIKVNVHLLNHDTQKLYNTFKEYVETIMDSPESLKTALESLEELAKQMPDLVKNAKSDVEGSSLGFKEKAQAMMRLKKNATKLPKELAKCKHLSEVLKEAATDLKQMIPELKTLMKSTEEVGKQAGEAKIYEPKKIFEKYHTGKRREEKKGEKKDEKKGEKKNEKKGEKKDEKKEQPKQHHEKQSNTASN